jgi:AraC-like DNA-binding protein
MQMTPNEFRKNVQSNPKMIVQLVNEDGISIYSTLIRANIFINKLNNHFRIRLNIFSEFIWCHLHKMFKLYITSLKIALSLSELVQNKQTIYQVSEQFGFNHYSNYTQQFKHFMQMTPNASSESERAIFKLVI